VRFASLLWLPIQDSSRLIAVGIDAATANNPAAPIVQIQFQSWYHPATIS
jgi:hypothetical protein